MADTKVTLPKLLEMLGEAHVTIKMGDIERGELAAQVQSLFDQTKSLTAQIEKLTKALEKAKAKK